MISWVRVRVKTDFESLVVMWQDTEEWHKTVNHQVHILVYGGLASRKRLNIIKEQILEKQKMYVVNIKTASKKFNTETLQLTKFILHKKFIKWNVKHTKIWKQHTEKISTPLWHQHNSESTAVDKKERKNL